MIDTTASRIEPSQVAALADGAAVQARPEAGVLRLTGNDRADFLHRMTTN
ncbi:MAG: hypothetical protein HC802_14100, partial [Caldilineaceae bacterium]|nr:hypothetical protein [Caldilineaceae bacterium]